MTTKQRREHKQGNQLRKAALMEVKKRVGGSYWGNYPVIQDGKYTKTP